MNDVGVHAVDDFASFEAGLGDLCPDGVSISGVEARGVAGMDISSVSGLSSMLIMSLSLLVHLLFPPCTMAEVVCTRRKIMVRGFLVLSLSLFSFCNKNIISNLVHLSQQCGLIKH